MAVMLNILGVAPLTSDISITFLWSGTGKLQYLFDAGPVMSNIPGVALLICNICLTFLWTSSIMTMSYWHQGRDVEYSGRGSVDVCHVCGGDRGVCLLCRAGMWPVHQQRRQQLQPGTQTQNIYRYTDTVIQIQVHRNKYIQVHRSK